MVRRDEPSGLSPAEREQLARELHRSEAALGARFLQLATGARSTWPEFQTDLGVFADHVARVLHAPDRDFSRALGELCMGDLYLACGCLLGAEAALSAFEERYLRGLRTFVNEVDSCAARLDELKQLLRERLLVEVDGAPARIGSYSGRGELAGWVQVAAQRLALSSLRGNRPGMLPADDALPDQLIAGPDQELDYLRLRYAQEFRDALLAALQQLPARERLILRLHLLDGLSLTRIAAAYRVSQSTISRWLLQARETVHDHAKQTLREVLGLSSGEFDSIARLVHSRLDFSLSAALRSTGN